LPPRAAGAGAVAQASREDRFVSIVRVGLAETKKFAEGYEAIFGAKKKAGAAKKDKPAAKKTTAKKKTKKK
jgi:hypothetical protein